MGTFSIKFKYGWSGTSMVICSVVGKRTPIFDKGGSTMIKEEYKFRISPTSSVEMGPVLWECRFFLGRRLGTIILPWGVVCEVVSGKALCVVGAFWSVPKFGWVVLNGLISSLFCLSLTRLKMSTASPSMLSMPSAIKGVGLFYSIESLSSTNSGKFVGAVEGEPWVGVCSSKESGIMTKRPGRVVCRAVVGGRGCSPFPISSMLVSKEPEDLCTLKSFRTKCTKRIRSLEAILGKN